LIKILFLALIFSKNFEEVIFHIPSEYDYRYLVKDFYLMIEIFISFYYQVRKINIPCYYMNDISLEKYHTTQKDAQNKIKKIP